MILNTPEFQEFNRRQMGSDKLTFEEACRIHESLHQEALTLGVISSDNIWDGFEVDLRIAKAINEMRSVRPPCIRRPSGDSTPPDDA